MEYTNLTNQECNLWKYKVYLSLSVRVWPLIHDSLINSCYLFISKWRWYSYWHRIGRNTASVTGFELFPLCILDNCLYSRTYNTYCNANPTNLIKTYCTLVCISKVRFRLWLLVLPRWVDSCNNHVIKWKGWIAVTIM